MLILILFFAGLTQSLAGFGFALVAMPLLSMADLPLIVAAPLVALLGLINRPIIILHYRAALSWREIWRLSLSALVAIPFGVWLQGHINEHIITGSVGIIIIGYAIVNIADIYTPKMKSHLWEWGLGLISGILGGAYNIAGPPAIIYANGQQWEPNKFRANLQTFALISSLFIVISHLMIGNYTINILFYFSISLPAMLFGLYLGIYLANHIQPEGFRKGILLLLIVIGIRLII